MQPTTKGTSVKTLRRILRSSERHWVGDGFPVRTLFDYSNHGVETSPFLLFDYAGPMTFPPTSERLGVGAHPHRGFETVTIVYEGEVEHRDSSGGGGRIGPGDVQWMTAASGIVHEEFQGREFARRGGLFEVVQLWINLPAKHKMSPPHYQPILGGEIPEVALPNGAGKVRVIAGEFAGAKGPAKTFTPVQVWELRLTGGRRTELVLPNGYSTALVVLKGALGINDNESIREAEVGLFDLAGESFSIEAEKDTTALLLSGEPINEPIVGQGPFVMNTAQEIRQAMTDYLSGKMGQLA